MAGQGESRPATLRTLRELQVRTSDMGGMTTRELCIVTGLKERQTRRLATLAGLALDGSSRPPRWVLVLPVRRFASRRPGGAASRRR